MLAVAVAGTSAVGAAFAGSEDRIAAGVRVAGVDVGGLAVSHAQSLLTERAARYASVPVVFTAGTREWEIPPKRLGVRVDWERTVAEAREAGDGPWLLRGLKRLKVRLLGVDVDPSARASRPALRFQLERIAREVDVPARDAAIVLRGLTPVLESSAEGRALDRRAAERTLVGALAGFDRRPVALPVERKRPGVATSDLVPVAAQVRTALSAPVRFGYKNAHWRIRPAQLATLLLLPAEGRRELRIGGPAAESYFGRLARAVARDPKDADFAVTGAGDVRVVPATSGRALDVEASGAELLRAAVSARRRDAALVVSAVEPKLTTREARRLGITKVLASFSTPYSGTAERIRNLQLAVSLLDATLVAPGDTFSFNEAVGPRTEERGFGPAPVIVGGEYEEGIGGGVSQVATTVFNAAWEAGLRITSRTAHALYISRYPLGRDATVSYPQIDLTFANDTRNWIFVRAAAGESGIAVTLLGGRTGRRVVSEAGPLVETSPPRVKKILDPTLYEGEKVVVDDGEPGRSVTVTRTVYAGERVLYDETWTTSYRSEPKIVRVGTLTAPLAPPPPERERPKAEPKKKAEPAPQPPPAKTTTTPTPTQAGG